MHVLTAFFVVPFSDLLVLFTFSMILCFMFLMYTYMYKIVNEI